MLLWVLRNSAILAFFGAHLLVLAWIARRLPRTWTRRRFLRAAGVVFAASLGVLFLRSLAIHDGQDWMMRTWGVLQLWGMTILSTGLVLWLYEIASVVARRPSPIADPPENQAPNEDRRRAMTTIGGLAVGAVSAAPILWGALHTRLDVETVVVPLRLPRFPKALDGFTVVQLTDVHVGAYVGDRELARAEEIVRSMKPDLLVFTGDLVNLQRRWIVPAARFLRRVGDLARFGAKAIVGNHEHYAGVYRMMEAMKQAGVDVLFNDGGVVAPNDGGGFGIVGVDDVFGPALSGTPGPRVAGALSKLRPDRTRVLLCHQPTYLESASAYGFDLMLSGHTHGGQIEPLGPIVARRVYGVASGLAFKDDTVLYVSRGYGISGPPTRVGVRPEITKIVLSPR